MTLSNTQGLLNARQVAALLNWDVYLFHKVWQDTEGVVPPETTDPEPLWTTAQVREMREVVKPQPRKRIVNWADNEYLTARMCGELHNPPIMLRSFFANLARKRTREQKGLTVDGGVPEPDRKILGHPVWAPETLREYLANRPGPGNHRTKAEGRNGYTGGRVPGTKVRRNKTAVAEDLVAAE